jgi:protoporphyrinogen oxidase
MAKIIIIGGGLTGLSAAYHLEQAGYHNFKVFEKEAQIGGLCRSIYQDGFTFDYTGHLLHISDPDFNNIIEKYIGKNNLNQINRQSFIYSHNAYTKYPFQTNLFGLPSNVIAECLLGYINRPTKSRSNSFYNWVLVNFGAGLAKHFFVPYQTKIFNYDIYKISASWTGRFVPQTSLEQIINGALSNQSIAVGYNANFFYPKQQGIFDWINKFAKQIKNPIQTNHDILKIDTKQKIIFFKNQDSEKYDFLINTMPLDNLLKISQEPTNQNLKSIASKLICNSVINFNLGVNRPNLSDKHWIYFPEKQYPFYRLGFYHNFSPHMTPPNCSSVYGEFSYMRNNKHQINDLLLKSINETKKLLNFDDQEILTTKIINIKHAYVIYNNWRDQNLKNIHKTLNHNKIYSCGRYGEWKYSSMQEAFLDGKAVVFKILKKIGFQDEN